MGNRGTLRKRVILLVIILLILLAGLFSWKSYDASKEDTVRSKVTSSIATAVDLHQGEGKRVLFQQQNSLPFYVTDFNNPMMQTEVLKDLVFHINNDRSLPPLKLEQFNMSQTSSIRVSVNVIYKGAFGIDKKIKVSETVKQVAFKNEKGTDKFE